MAEGKVFSKQEIATTSGKINKTPEKIPSLSGAFCIQNKTKAKKLISDYFGKLPEIDVKYLLKHH